MYSQHYLIYAYTSLLFISCLSESLALQRFRPLLIGLGLGLGSPDPIQYAEEGRIPQLDSAMQAVRLASTVVAMNTVNSTLLCVYSPAWSDNNGIIAQKNSSLHKAFHNIGGGLYLAITGLLGDATIVVRKTRQYFLKYVGEYGTSPSGRQLSDEISSITGQGLMGSRPLAVHAFVIDNKTPCFVNIRPDGMRTNHIYEIDTMGGTSRVNAGIAGKGSDMLKSRLETLYSVNITAQEGKFLCHSIISEANKLITSCQGYIDTFEIPSNFLENKVYDK